MNQSISRRARMKKPAEAHPAALPLETVEMLDGRVYSSTDNWQTVYVARPGAAKRRITGRAADMARYLAIKSH